MRSPLSLVAVSLLLASCGGAAATPARLTPRHDAPRPSAAQLDDRRALARDGNALGLSLWQLTSGNGNAAMSPASIQVALAMTYGGARGQTAREMRDAMGLDRDDAKVHATLGAMISDWSAGDRPYELAVANRLFGERTLRFEQPFLSMTRDAYGAPLELSDFVGQPDPARVRINDWVSARTHARIPALLPSGSIDSSTRLVLVNAIYFKGSWAQRFDPRETADAGFWVGGTTGANVPTMHETGRFAMGRQNGATMIALPYVGDRLEMLVVLPDSRDGLRGVEATLDVDRLAEWRTDLADHDDVQVSLPRFKVAPPAATQLGRALQSLGMVTPFDCATADFSGMTTADRICIDDVYHQAFVEVNEEGTEAAAATAVVMTDEAAMVPPSFTADHPFLFFVRDRESGAILFMGRVTDPRS